MIKTHISINNNPRLVKGWFLGIDLGTGSCKSVIVDEYARVLGFGAVDYAASGSQQKWQEQNPEALVDGLVGSVRSAISNAGVSGSACRALSIGGALHSLIIVDKRGRPLTGLITWADGRGAPQAQAVREASQAAQLYRRTGCPAHGMYPLYKILWLKQESPAVFESAARFMSAKEYVFKKLTGQDMVDYSLASGSGLLDVQDLDWNDLALRIAGVDHNQLAKPNSPATSLYGLDRTLAAALGIPADTRVVLGSSDAANSNIGAGALGASQATCMIGTSGAFRIIAPQPLLDKQQRMWCYAIDEAHWLTGGAINNGGIALSWLKDVLNQAHTRLPADAELSFEDLVGLAGEVGVGADGLVCLPFFAGERSPNWNLNARGVFFGLTLQHDARHLARALLEGVAFRLRSLNEILAEMVGEIREVRASGGFTHSQLWPQIIASVLNRNLLVPEWGETSSLGAALWAMLGAGAINSLEDAGELIQIGSKFQPIPGDASVYDRLYGLYSELYDRLRPSFDQIAGLQQELDNFPR